MRSHKLHWLAAACAVFLSVVVQIVAADPPPPAAMSKLAPADDLTAQVDFYVAAIRDKMTDPTAYADNARQVARDAHTLAALALVLAQYDQDHKLKAAAPALLDASRTLAKSKNFESATAAFARVTAAAGGEAASAPDVKWEKVASLGSLMKQASLANNRVKRNLRRFDEHREEAARDAALLAAIGQAVIFDTHEVKNPADMDKWYQLCNEMRDTAGSLNAAIHANDKDAAEKAFATLAKNCQMCHESFRVGAEP